MKLNITNLKGDTLKASLSRYYGELVFLFLTVLLIAGCTKDKRLMYEEDPRIYFTKFILGVTNPDSAIYSFTLKPADQTKDTAYLTMRIMGSAVDRDRVIKVIVSPTSTAKEGYHFDFGPLIMPANEYQTQIPVFLYRKPGLKDSIVHLELAVGTSVDFKPGYEDKVRGSAFDRLHYKISFTDQVLKPRNWDSYLVNYFGEYSKTKFEFMIRKTGKSEWERAIFPQDLNFYIQTVKRELLEYEKVNGPMLDENGNRISFP